MTPDQVPPPSGAPFQPEQPGLSTTTIALIGCGGLLGLIVVLTIAGVMLFRVDEEEPNVAAVSTVTHRLAASETSTAQSRSIATTERTSAAVTREPTPVAVGAAPSNPVPYGETAEAGDWQVRILEAFRGEDAYSHLLEANQFNAPPPPGMEYVLVNLWVKYVGSETEAQSVDFSWFHATGDARVKWSWAVVVDPTPNLSATLFSGAEATGWTTVLAKQGESNHVLVVKSPFSFEEGDEAFLALEAGATVEPIRERLADENDLGLDRMNPVPLGERIVGETWEIWVIESIRGETALARIRETNQFNADPDPGMEYVLVHVGARNVNAAPGSQNIDAYSFKTTGDAGRVYDRPSVVDPEPTLGYNVYAGGEVDGWVTLQVALDEQHIRLVYEPAFSFTAQPRYLRID